MSVLQQPVSDVHQKCPGGNGILQPHSRFPEEQRFSKSTAPYCGMIVREKIRSTTLDISLIEANENSFALIQGAAEKTFRLFSGQI